MDAPEHNSYLLNIPVLVLEKILSNIHNPSNVSRTCKYLYEIACGLEKARRVMYISGFDETSSLNIDADAVFASIMNSHRTIKEIEIRLDYEKVYGTYTSYEINERQWERMQAIMKRFGANITSLKVHRFVLSVSQIIQLLQQAPKLESLSFTDGKVMGSVTENTTMSLHLPKLKSLEIEDFPGLLDIVNLIPAGSLNSYCSEMIDIDQSTESTEVFTTILTKQYNIKSLTLEVGSNSDLTDTAFCVDHLQLETLILKSFDFDEDSQFADLLKCQTNLKELRLISNNYELSESLLQWICNNLKKLEVLEVQRLDSTEKNAFAMLDELKQLRHFRTYVEDGMFDNGFQSFQFKSDSIEKFEIRSAAEFTCGKLLNKMVDSQLAHNLPNLTHLQMKFENFAALSFVLGRCTNIIHLISCIGYPITDQLLTQQRFPNIQYLELGNYDRNLYQRCKYEMMNQSMVSIVRTMPNLKSMTLLTKGFNFDVNTMKEFIKESKSLKYFYVDKFILNREMSTDDVVKTIRCLMDQLNGYNIIFCSYTLTEDWHWHKIKDMLSDEFYVQDDCTYPQIPTFYLYKGGQKIEYAEF